MATEGKYGKILVEKKEIPEDEPVFLFRGQDPRAPNAVRRYAQECLAYGCPTEYVDDVFAAADRMSAWQKANPGRVKKQPD